MLQLHVYMTQNKTKKKHSKKTTTLAVTAGCVRFFEKRLKAALGGGKKRRTGWRAQLEDLLIALADRRSFPETRFFVARGIVGETWSTVSVVVAAAAAVLFPASVLTLPVKEPGREMERDFEDRKKKKTNDGEGQVRQHGRVGSFVWLLFYPSMLCHARGCSHNQDHRIFTETYNANCKKDSDLSSFYHLNH